jgi:hypothetical protein
MSEQRNDDNLPIQVDEDVQYDTDEMVDNATIFLDGPSAEPDNQPKTKAKATKPKARGVAYTPIEDYMICTAFIAASEDAIHGVSQKGKHFQETMYRFFLENLLEQESMEAQRMNRPNMTFISPLPQGKVYEKRSANAIHERFKAISLKCSKLFGTESSTKRPSGYDDDRFEKLVNFQFNNRWSVRCGPAEEVRYCYNYLKHRQKWSSFAVAQETAEKRHPRPTGNKKVKKMAAEKAAVVSAVKEYRDINDKQQPTSTIHNKVEADFYATMISTAQSYCQTQKDDTEMAYISMMNDEDKKEILLVKKQVILANYKQILEDMNTKKRANDAPVELYEEDEEDNDDDYEAISKRIF